MDHDSYIFMDFQNYFQKKSLQSNMFKNQGYFINWLGCDDEWSHTRKLSISRFYLNTTFLIP